MKDVLREKFVALKTYITKDIKNSLTFHLRKLEKYEQFKLKGSKRKEINEGNESMKLKTRKTEKIKKPKPGSLKRWIKLVSVSLPYDRCPCLECIFPTAPQFSSEKQSRYTTSLI